MAWAIYWRYLQALGSSLSEEEFSQFVPNGLQYKGEYLIDIGNSLIEKYGDGLTTKDLKIADPSFWINIVKDFAINKIFMIIKEDLEYLGVYHDIFTSEKN